MKVEILTATDGRLAGITVSASPLPAAVAVCAAAQMLYEMAGALREETLDELEAQLRRDDAVGDAVEQAAEQPAEHAIPTLDRPDVEDATEDSPPPGGPVLGARALPAAAGSPRAAAGTPTSPAEQTGGGVVIHAAPEQTDVDERTRAAADELLAAGVGPAAVATELALPLRLVRSWKQEMR